MGGFPGPDQQQGTYAVLCHSSLRLTDGTSSTLTDVCKYLYFLGLEVGSEIREAGKAKAPELFGDQRDPVDRVSDDTS